MTVAAPHAVPNERHYQPGEIVFHEGDYSDCAYVVLEGEVEVYRRVARGTVRLATLGPGEIFGEMGVVDDCPRFATVAARTSCRVRTIGREEIAAVISCQPVEFGILLRALMERLRQSSTQLSALADKQANLQMSASGSIKAPAVQRITMKPMTEALKQMMPANGILISSLPYRVGALPEGETPNPLDWNHLCIQGADVQQMARNHFMLHKSEEGLVVTDRGSATGTLVNGQPIGTGSEEYRATLRYGENIIVAGRADSPYRFAIIWE